MNYQVDIFQKFDQGWALLTAGTPDHFNTMTVSWGAMGTIWGKPAVTVYVRQSWYTLEFMNSYDTFTISFFPEQYKKDLGILGSRSGRDGDKIALTKLKPKAIGNAVTFEQAETTLVCKKMYCQFMDLDAMPKDVQEQYYSDHDVHYLFIGEVTDLIEEDR